MKEYQFDTGSVQGLVSTAHRQDKVKKSELEVIRDPIFPKKVRSVASTETNNQPKRIQENYYETDSSSENSDSEAPEAIDIKQEIQTVAKDIDEIEVLDTKSKQDGVELQKLMRQKRMKEFYHILESIKGENVPVHRHFEIQSKRSKLPIFAEEMNIVEAINDNAVCSSCISYYYYIYRWYNLGSNSV